MAQRVITVLEDDIDGGEATETIRFGLDGTNYEIDLNEKNAKKLRGALEAYIEHARKATTGSRGRRLSSARSGGPSPAEIREWATANGFDVPSRGRIPANVREAYDAAH